jgi:site-specific DNA recombinase
MVEEEARVVRQVFAWVGIERVGLREAGRRLQRAGRPTRTGLGHWDATTLGGMLRNPAYQGTAMFGRTRVAAPAQERLRPIRGRPQPPRNTVGSSAAVPREEWIAIPVPAIVEAGVFEAAQVQLDENRRRKRDGRRRPGWLLQGLTVCRRCGYEVSPVWWTGSGLGWLRFGLQFLLVANGRAVSQGGVQPHRVVEAFDEAEAGRACLGL